jgi:signal transduction histidine kinase
MKQIIARGVQQLERLRDYSRQQPEPRAEEVDLDDLAREAVALAKPLMSSRGGRLNRIREELAHPPKVMGRSAEIVSAIVNLVVNAIDAMPDGGSIRVRTGSDERHAWIEVEDEGPGIPPEVRERIFEPFFTTKGKEGSGLGLAMVHACMQRHCGSVQLDTAPGKGSTFRLLFPIPQ